MCMYEQTIYTYIHLYYIYIYIQALFFLRVKLFCVGLGGFWPSAQFIGRVLRFQISGSQFSPQ